MDEYCRRYAKQNKNLQPSQLLLHKKQKIALCYVPKAAGTTFKVLLLHSQGMLPNQYLDYNKYKQPYFGDQLRKIFLSTLDSEEQDAVTRDYNKFIMLRHPLEQLFNKWI